jgi:hypothetical protein
MVDLQRRRATLVLSNTRGYLVDVANFIGLLMSSSGEPLFRHQCDRVQELVHHVTGSYLWGLYRYEESVHKDVPRLADPDAYGGYIGRYQLCHYAQPHGHSC